jgi:hypothetical protein
MNEPLETNTATCESLAHIGERIQCRLGGRVRDFQVFLREQGVVLRGRALSYHAKQLAQQAVMETVSLPIRANEIVVSRA